MYAISAPRIPSWIEGRQIRVLAKYREA